MEFFFTYLFYYFFFDELFSYHIFLFLIFLIGIFSDLNSIKSANKRFLLQAFTVLICVVFNQMSIQNTGIDLSINQRRVNAILRQPRQYVPEYNTDDLELIEVWAGLRPLTPDGLALLGRSNKYQNLTLAAGHAAIGMSSGPASGQIVSQIVRGERPFMDISLMNPSRFG